MAKSLDAVLVVDLEATCWSGPPPPDQTSEVIEVGLCLLDVATLRRSDKRTLWVRPTGSEVSPFCTQLTTIRPEDVAGAPSLAEACDVLRREYASRARLWVSYGDYDRRQLERECAAKGVAYPFGPSHLNVKSLAAVVLGHTREAGLPATLERLGLPLEGTHHRGADDAWNIAAVLAELLRRARG